MGGRADYGQIKGVKVCLVDVAVLVNNREIVRHFGAFIRIRFDNRKGGPPGIGVSPKMSMTDAPGTNDQNIFDNAFPNIFLPLVGNSVV